MSELGLTGRAWCVVFSSYVAVRSSAWGVWCRAVSACRLLFGGGLEDSEEGKVGRGAEPPILPRIPINSHKIHTAIAFCLFPFFTLVSAHLLRSYRTYGEGLIECIFPCVRVALTTTPGFTTAICARR